MKSSMGITKIAAFRFMLLLHLFLKVKMCVGFVDAAAVAVAAGDSDINYEDSDEWLPPASLEGMSSTPQDAGSVPAPANLMMRWEEADPPRGNSGHPARMHHVRHEQHYLQHRSVRLPGAVGMVDPPEPGPYLAHTVTTTTVIGPQQKMRHSPDHSQQHKEHQQQQHRQQNRHHNHHQHHHHHKPHTDRSRVSASGVVAQQASAAPKHGPARFVPTPGDIRDAFHSERLRHFPSSSREDRNAQVQESRKSAGTSFRGPAVIGNALSDASGSSSGSSSKTVSARSVNPHSQKYFEDLLTEYKRRSPIYKELHQPRSPQTKALTQQGKGKSRGTSADASKTSNSRATDAADYIDYDADYDDGNEEDLQNDAAYGAETFGKASTTTSTTTTTTTMAPTTTTTVRSGLADGSVQNGDVQYSAYYQMAYAKRPNSARNGNNRYSQQRQRLQSGVKKTDNQLDDSEESSVMTKYKQAKLGTPDAVKKTYDSYKNHKAAQEKVHLHLEHVLREASCKVPKARVVEASSDRSRSYTPSCTILHRCDNEAGCCMPPEICAPKSTAKVELYFFVTVIGSGITDVEALQFENHTECHCVLDRGASQRQAVSQSPVRGSLGSSEDTATTLPTCQCPEPFKPIIDRESYCYCDCVSGNRDCIRFKEGHEHFPMRTRSKILNNQCKAPSCEYGPYRRAEGKCPTKKEQMDLHFSRYR